MATGKEKRKHPRVVPLESAPIEVQIMGTGFLEVLYAEDISLGGMAVVVPHGFSEEELSESVELIVTMPGSKPFKTRGTIRHISRGSNSGRFGVQFQELSETQQAHIGWYVEKLLMRGRGA
jgi:c-di-GMP-binding flagellar brake protein YcgR